MNTIVTLCILGSFSLLINLAFTPTSKEVVKPKRANKGRPLAPQRHPVPGRKGVNYREEVRKMFLADSGGMARAIKGSLEDKGGGS